MRFVLGAGSLAVSALALAGPQPAAAGSAPMLTMLSGPANTKASWTTAPRPSLEFVLPRTRRRQCTTLPLAW